MDHSKITGFDRGPVGGRLVGSEQPLPPVNTWNSHHVPEGLLQPSGMLFNDTCYSCSGENVLVRVCVCVGVFGGILRRYWSIPLCVCFSQICIL